MPRRREEPSGNEHYITFPRACFGGPSGGVGLLDSIRPFGQAAWTGYAEEDKLMPRVDAREEHCAMPPMLLKEGPDIHFAPVDHGPKGEDACPGVTIGKRLQLPAKVGTLGGWTVCHPFPSC